MELISEPKKSTSIGTQSSAASESIIRPRFSEESDEDTKETIKRVAMHVYQSLMISAVGNHIIPLLTSHRKREQTAKLSAMPTGVAYLGMITVVNGICFRMLQSKQQYGVALHITTAGTVLKSYALLLLINTRYSSLAMIPVMMIVFVAALCRKFWVQTCRRQLQHDSRGDSKATSGVSRESEEQLALIGTVLPFWLQLPGTSQPRDGVLVSHFLVFFSSALVALSTLITRTVPAGVYPGVSRVMPVMHKTCIVLLLVSVHTMAGEWFGTKTMALACTPELVALLISVMWFFHRFDAIEAHASNVICLILVAMWAIFMQDYRDTSFGGIAGLSAALCYFSSWILKKWPRAKSMPLSKEDGVTRSAANHDAPLVLQLLRISALICLFTSVSHAALQQLTLFVPREGPIPIVMTGILMIVPVLVFTQLWYLLVPKGPSDIKFYISRCCLVLLLSCTIYSIFWWFISIVVLPSLTKYL